MRINTITAHGRTIHMEEQPGKMGRCWRAGAPYERPLLERIYDQGFTGRAIDAGANFGNHTLWMAGVCGLRVEAFEPQPKQAAVLRRNVALNDLDVGTHELALGAERGVAELIDKGRFELGRGSTFVKPLDSYGFTDVAVIKADVEDMEPDVLAGAEETIRRCRPVIYAEAHEGQHDLIAAVLEPWYSVTGSYNAKESVTPVEEWTWSA